MLSGPDADSALDAYGVLVRHSARPGPPLALEDLIAEVLRRKASDLHLTAGQVPVLRVGGDLEPIEGAAVATDDEMVSLVGLLTGAETTAAGTDGPAEVDCAFTSGDHRFRVNVYRSSGRLSAALRAIPLDVPRMGDLDLPAALLRWPQERRGLLLCAGPTGSGKTTTLASVVRAISEERPCHIVTLEDPIEYLHHGGRALIHQRSIGEDSVSFASALRAVLREDPDVIMVGEMRDPESVRLALTAAETGHLVLSTVHAADSIGVINRLVDVFPGDEQPQVRTMLANTLLGVSCQTLVRDALVPGRRHLVAEVLVVNDAVRASIREGRPTAVAQAVETGAASGMQTFDRAFALAVHETKVSRAEAEALTPGRASFLRCLRDLGA